MVIDPMLGLRIVQSNFILPTDGAVVRNESTGRVVWQSAQRLTFLQYVCNTIISGQRTARYRLHTIMDVKNLFKHAEEIENYLAGAVIFNVSDPAQHFYVVLEGEVEVRLGDRLLNKVTGGGLLGEMALVGDHKRSGTAIAKTNCKLAAVDEKRFLFLVRETPFFALHVMNVMAERLIQSERSMRDQTAT
jgi:CRP/FNR family transcriptional regulator, cyclic AMP receptor protein